MLHAPPGEAAQVGARNLLLLLAVAATWGASYLFIEIALDDDVPPAAIVTARITLGFAVVVVWAAATGALRHVRGHVRGLLLLGGLQYALPLLLIAQGQVDISGALAGVLVSSTPVWSVALAPLLGGGRQPALAWVGVLVGLAGIALLLGLDPSAVGAAGTVGGLLVVGAALCYALAIAYAARGFAGVPKATLLAGGLGTGALLSLPALALDPPEALPGAGAAAALVALGTLGTGLAFVLFYRVLADVGPERASLVTYLATCFAVAYGALLRDEPVGVVTVVGLVLVVAGAVLAGRRRRRAPAAGPGAAGGPAAGRERGAPGADGSSRTTGRLQPAD